MSQNVDTLAQPIYSNSAGAPLVIRTVTPRAGVVQMEGGVLTQGGQISEYVLLSALPQELRERVVTAIKAISQV